MTERTATDVFYALAATPAEMPTVPGFELLSELGRGGMGVVYKARQLSANRLVALKLIRDSALAGPQERGRFRIEADAAARMRHPNIVEVYDVGEHQGRPYFAMELVEGGSLDKQLAGQPLPAEDGAELVRSLAIAIQHAHEQKVVHRDLKPANILLQVDLTQRRQDAKTSLSSFAPLRLCERFLPKITDFGLAKRLDSDSTALTQDGAVLGTASYMAPEQAAGRVRDVGPAVDIYALGAILYELLTGRPPFQGDSWNKMVEQVLHEEPARLRLDVPRDLETICLKCLEKDPGRRYASAGELAVDLGRFIQGEPVAALPVSAQERLLRLAARDGYQILGEIGHGPQSKVYHARYGPLQQPVALKVFSEGISTREEWEDRMRRSATMWAALAHPHIVPVQRAGWWDDAPYVATELVAQGSLAAKLTGKPYPVREALRLVEQLAEIVSFVHRQGVVHGNLKPSNVLFAADGIPRLVDFRATGGLFIGPLHADAGLDSSLGYLAPELIADPGAELHLSTDIYGLGAILYESLTGRPPFAAATAAETIEQVRAQTPVALCELNPEVTPQLQAICLRCLRKNPWKRYHRAYDVMTRMRYSQDDPAGERWRQRMTKSDSD